MGALLGGVKPQEARLRRRLMKPSPARPTPKRTTYARLADVELLAHVLIRYGDAPVCDLVQSWGATGKELTQ